jgi:hypothetical protein
MILVQIKGEKNSPRPAPALPALLYKLLHTITTNVTTTTLHIHMDMDLSRTTVILAHICASRR